MSVSCFVDTNILVYAVSSSEAEFNKKNTALDLIETSDLGLSTQVLQEFFVTVTSKIKKPLSQEHALALLDELRLFPLVETDYPLIVAAIELSLRYGIHYWDGAILAAATRLGATTLYTEDLNHGQMYGPVRVINPFVADRVHEPQTRYG